MDPTNVPLELISYRGLLKTWNDIRNVKDAKNDSKPKMYYKMMEPTRSFISNVLVKTIVFIESFLYVLMSMYDNYVYTPLQICLSPVVRIIPRYIYLDNNTKLTVFSANAVTLSRTFLIVPIAWFLKYDLNFYAFLCVIFHDFLDHLDGIVAKVQRVTYPNVDDPILGGFLDAFCDKIVNVFSLWTIIQMVNFSLVENNQAYFFLIICYGVIAYESVIGVVRVQDFFLAKFKRDYQISDSIKSTETSTPAESANKVTAASMEGKLKEKLESTGIALLCMAVSKSNVNPIYNQYGIAGLICLLLTLRMAHKSLALKIKARSPKKIRTRSVLNAENLKISPSADNLLHLIQSDNKDHTNHPQFENAQMKMIDYNDSEIKDQNKGDAITFSYKRRRQLYLEDQIQDNVTTPKSPIDPNFDKTYFFPPQLDIRVDKVFTIGCFDLFHYGHVQLISRMREFGKKIIVGVHDSRSIYKLKNRVPVDSTEKRMLNVKTVADEVFCIAGTDPSAYISCIVNLDPNETAMYVRGDDMKNFPSREVVETLMPIKFLPYTEGVSSSQIRKEQYSHIAAHDLEYLEKIN